MKGLLGKFLSWLRPKGKKPATPKVEKEEKLKRRWWEFPFQKLTTSQGGFNMPKRQPCPQCHRSCKRESKTATGARYNCTNCHKTFFVKGSRGQLREKRRQQRAKRGKTSPKKTTTPAKVSASPARSSQLR